MKKFFEKFTVLIQAIISLIFVLFIILLLTGALHDADFNNNVVYILFGTFITLYFLFTVLSIFFQYSADVLTSVGIYLESASVTKISVSAMRKIIRNAVKNIQGVKIGHSTVYYDEKGLVLNNPVRVKDRELNSAIEEAREAIIFTFREMISLEFVSVNFKITSYKYQTPPMPEKAPAPIQKKTPVKNTVKPSSEAEPINNSSEQFNNPVSDGTLKTEYYSINNNPLEETAITAEPEIRSEKNIINDEAADFDKTVYDDYIISDAGQKAIDETLMTEDNQTDDNKFDESAYSNYTEELNNSSETYDSLDTDNIEAKESEIDAIAEDTSENEKEQLV